MIEIASQEATVTDSTCNRFMSSGLVRVAHSFSLRLQEEGEVVAGGAGGCAGDLAARAPAGLDEVVNGRVEDHDRAGAVRRQEVTPSGVLPHVRLACHAGGGGSDGRGHHHPRFGRADQGGRPPPPLESGCFDHAVAR